MTARLTRRGALVAGLAGVSVVAGAGALVDRKVLPQLASSVVLETGRLDGAGWWIARPASDRPLPVVLALHGAYNDAAGWRRKLSLDTALEDAGSSFALAGIDGGEHGYWHPRSDGRDPRALVLDRFLPLLQRRGLDIQRPGFLGWSMGGYGALLLATEVGTAGPVVATSPALWSRYADSAPGAFDSEADFARWSVLGTSARLRQLAQLSVRVDCGSSDPFVPGVDELRRELPSARIHVTPGAHEAAYWKRVLPGQLRWLDARV